VQRNRNNHPRLAWRELRASPCKLFFRALTAFAMLLLCATAGVSQTASSTPDPKDSLAQADALLKDGKAEEALALLHNVAANDPNLPGLEAALGKACFETRRFPQAIQHLTAALQQKPGDLETMQVLALTYYASGDYQQALPLLEKIGPNLPKTSADGPYLLGICYIMTQRWDDARRTFAQMFSVPPDSSMAYLMFGKILIRQRMEQRAIPEIEKALEMDPRLPMAHFLLGELALYKKDAQAAVNEFQKELAINPTVWLVYWRLGDAYVRLENYDEAEKVLKQAIWLNEWSSGAYILLGQIALKKDESGIAVGFLERALKLDPNNYWVHYFLAKAYHNVGRTAEATQHFEISKSLRNDQLADDRNMLQTVP
jgi:tetratricopeptide (TPR) repeat protein